MAILSLIHSKKTHLSPFPLPTFDNDIWPESLRIDDHIHLSLGQFRVEAINGRLREQEVGEAV